MSKNNTPNEPKIIDGGLSVDGRGQVAFVNDFDFKNVRRFYTVSNHQVGFVRAWHAHKKEAKYVLATKGAAIVGVVAIDNFKTPSKEATVTSYVLSEKKPKVLYIPAGYGNGFMSLTKDTQLIFFSTFSIDESRDDDFRYDSRYWDIWTVQEK